METIFNATALVQHSLAGDRHAFGEIVKRYQSAICGMAFAATGDLALSEDIAQETFVTAWRRLGTLRDPEKLGGWIRAIARNAIRNHYRKTGRDVTSGADALDHAGDLSHPDAESPRDRVLSEERLNLLWETLAELPEPYREPLVLFYVQGQSTASVAEVMDLPESSVRQRLFRGRAMLREEMAAFVEETLEKTSPKKAFTVTVLAALPALAPQATAAALGATAAKGSLAAKSAGLTGLLGMFLGPILAILGGVAGVRIALKNARSPEERRFLLRATWVTVAYILGFVALLVIVTAFIGPWTRTHPNPVWHASMILGWSLLYTLCLVAILFWVNRRIHRIRVATDTNPPPVLKPMSKQSKRQTVFAFTGATYGSVAWTLPASLEYGPWWACLAFFAAATVLLMVLLTQLSQKTVQFWRLSRVLVVFVVALNMMGVVIFWERSGAEDYLSMQDAMLLVMGIGISCILGCMWREKRQAEEAGQQDSTRSLS